MPRAIPECQHSSSHGFVSGMLESDSSRIPRAQRVSNTPEGSRKPEPFPQNYLLSWCLALEFLNSIRRDTKPKEYVKSRVGACFSYTVIHII